MNRQLRVDWPACEARPAPRALPEIVDLDEWGYPIVTGPVTAELRADAVSAVRACPRLALRIVE